MNYYWLPVIVAILCSTVRCLEEGDTCTVASNGQLGTCTTLQKCPAALQLIQKLQFPQTCGYAGTSPIVCCSLSGSSSNKSLTTKETTVTTTGTTTQRGSIKRCTSSYPNPFRPNTTGYKSFQKCEEYSNLPTYEIPPTLIIGGVPAEPREFPHMVLVGYNSPEGIKWLCGGTLINERFVLTAGHCLISRDLGNASKARIGVRKINDPDHKQDFSIIERIRHPKYEPPSHYNDIGLLKLEKSVSFNLYVKPACLYYDSKALNGIAVATGWGNTEFAGYSSDELLKVTLELVDVATCNESFKRVSPHKLDSGIIDTTQVCAGSPGKDTCQGDSGGPLQIYSGIKCMYEVIGVTSFGKACGLGKSVGIYTRVSYYVDWIENTVWE